MLRASLKPLSLQCDAEAIDMGSALTNDDGSFVQVTLVMAYLNGNDIPEIFRHRTLFTKVCILFLHVQLAL